MSRPRDDDPRDYGRTLQDFDTISIKGNSEIRVRVREGSDKVRRLDIRLWVRNERPHPDTEHGYYTPKGVSLTLDEADKLFEQYTEIRALLDPGYTRSY